jgi:Protein of unknown function (DUF2892)
MIHAAGGVGFHMMKNSRAESYGSETAATAILLTMRENMGGTEKNIRLAIGSAAAAAAVWAPLRYKWKGVLSAIAATQLIFGMIGFSPTKRVLRIGAR